MFVAERDYIEADALTIFNASTLRSHVYAHLVTFIILENTHPRIWADRRGGHNVSDSSGRGGRYCETTDRIVGATGPRIDPRISRRPCVTYNALGAGGFTLLTEKTGLQWDNSETLCN